MPAFVITALLGSMMRTHTVSKRNDDLKIMLNRIMLRPSGRDHLRVSILRMLRALGEHCSLGLEATDPSGLTALAVS